MGSLTTFARTELLNHTYNADTYTPPAAIYLALCDADPTAAATGAACNEVDNIANYSRKAITFGAASSRAITQNALTEYDLLNDALATASHWCIVDSATYGAGNALAFGEFDEAKDLVSGNRPYVKSGEVVITAASGELSNYLAEAWLNFMFRNQAFSSPDTHVGWADTIITDSDTGSTVSEPSAGDYARVQVNPAGGASPAWTTASAAALDNDDDVAHEPATAPQGDFVAVFVADAATAGNLLMYDNTVADQTVGTDDTVRWPAGDLDIVLT